MDKGQTPFNALAEDNYSLFVPIEDHDLLKSVTVDENGDYIVQGVMTSDAMDEEDDSITPEGMDCSYFLEKGWIKYEHGNKPEQFIGEPIEVRVGRFEHPTLMKAVNGIFVKGRLFSARGLTKSAIEAMQDLQKSNTKRRMGWSIEGNVKKRDKAGKIVKSVLRNVVLTMNPVNTTTWAELAKSFAKDHELTISMPDVTDVTKAMDIAGAQAITKQSIEGYDPDKDKQQEWIDAFREMVKKALVNKSFQDEFIRGRDEAEHQAFALALAKGFDFEEADEFGAYIAEKHSILKALVINYGGEKMSKETKGTLASLLDSDLDELKKSIEADNGDDVNDDEYKDEDEEVTKSQNKDDENDEDTEEGTKDGRSSEDEVDNDDNDDDEKTEKSLRTDLSKSLAEGGHQQAFEVSDFLADLTDEIGFSLNGFEKSIGNVTKTQHAVVKALTTLGDLVKSISEENAGLRTEVGELQKSLGDVMNRPVGRKSVVNQREVQTLSKSLDNQGSGQPLSRHQQWEILMKSFEAGEIPGSIISRFEAGTPLSTMNLPEGLKNALKI